MLMSDDHTPHETVPVPEGDGTDHPLRGVEDHRFTDQPVAESFTGLRVPKLGLGTAGLHGGQCREIVSEALELGVRHLDTAQAYGNETDVGAGIEAAGVACDEIFVTTKVDDDSHEPGDLVSSVEASLDRLGTDHVDLLLIHWPVHWEIVAATIHTLGQVQASGMAHHVGVSNFTVGQLDEVAHLAPLEALQVECHPFFQQPELRSWCVDAGWVFTAYSPLAQGEVHGDEALNEIAASRSVSPTAVALAWLIGLDGVTAIPRTSDPDHLRDNWSALSIDLTPDERARIDALDRGLRLVDPEHAPWRVG